MNINHSDIIEMEILIVPMNGQQEMINKADGQQQKIVFMIN